MDQATYEKWWPLHIKSARQEPLTAEEQAFYETGRKELESEEVIHTDFEELRRIRDAVKASETELEELREQSKQLKARIAALEASLPRRTKELLGIQDG